MAKTTLHGATTQSKYASKSKPSRQMQRRELVQAGRGKKRGLPPQVPLEDTLLNSTRNKIKTAMGKQKKSKLCAVQQQQRKRGGQNGGKPQHLQRKMQAAIKTPDPGYQTTPVLFLVKDAPKGQTRRQLGQPHAELLHKSLRGTRRLSKRKPKQGMDFFYNMGQRLAKTRSIPLVRASVLPKRLSAGECLGLEAPRKELPEVPLTNHLPIIDFISTQEFQSMYLPPKRKRSRRS